MDKYLIVGLGNPGYEYENTRHNTGFMVLDKMAESVGVSFEDKRYGYVAETSIKGRKVFLLKPTTYMNLSGESLREIIDFYKLDPAEELIVIYDDISLDPGQLRIRVKGSAGGHNGIKSIISHLGSEFMRVKMGVGEKPAHYDLADYVLGHFQKADRELVEEAMDRAVEAIAMMVQGDCAGAMNHYNKKVER